MADMSSKSRKLSINLSLFTFTEALLKLPIKSPKKFEEPNGVVGLGILAAMSDDDDNCKDPFLKRASTPVFSSKKSTSFSARRMNTEEMELCEEYTCVIAHVGDKQIKKKEYFDSGNGNGVFLGSSTDIVIPGPEKIYAGWGEANFFRVADFLNSCFLCEKQLHGLDIFMYRGEKAFCSAECRDKQIAVDEHKEKRGSGSRKAREYSASPCSSSPMQFLAGVAAA